MDHAETKLPLVEGLGAVVGKDGKPKLMTERQARRWAERACASKNREMGHAKPFWNYSMAHGPAEDVIVHGKNPAYRRVSFYHEY